MSKYFIQKNGVYASGVYWIGDDLGEGMELGTYLAENDVDDYHEWKLFEYVEVNPLEFQGKEWYVGTHYTALPHKEICVFVKDVK